MGDGDDDNETLDRQGGEKERPRDVVICVIVLHAALV